MSKVKHSYCCPHDCEACSQNGSLKIDAWKNGGCIICGEHRNGNTYACTSCWHEATEELKQEAMEAIAATEKGVG